MSATVTRMVLAKRQNEALMTRREAIIAAAKGAAGDTGPMPDHEWKGTKLRFQKPEGEWGEWVDLKGKDGKDGKNGVVVVGSGDNSGGTSLNALQPGAANVEPSALVVQQGNSWVNLPWSAFVATIAGALDMATNTKRIDFVGDTVMYRGESVPGALESDPVWRIKKVVFGNDGDVTETWAGGTADAVHAWANRGSLAYS